jgi:hypothetical protein
MVDGGWWMVDGGWWRAGVVSPLVQNHRSTGTSPSGGGRRIQWHSSSPGRVDFMVPRPISRLTGAPQSLAAAFFDVLYVTDLLNWVWINQILQLRVSTFREGHYGG